MGSSGLARELMNNRINFGDGCSGRFPIFAPYACTRLVDPGVFFVEVTLLAMPAKVVRERVSHDVSHFLAESGKKNIAVIAPAFSADCIETLEEIQEEIQEAFVEAGGESFTYIPCLNDDDAHIAALLGVAERNLAGWLE